MRRNAYRFFRSIKNDEKIRLTNLFRHKKEFHLIYAHILAYVATNVKISTNPRTIE